MKFSSHQPMATQHDVLRQHGLFWHADWTENLAIHPRYVTQAVYFAHVPSTGPAVALLQSPMPTSRGFSNLTELPPASCGRFSSAKDTAKGPELAFRA